MAMEKPGVDTEKLHAVMRQGERAQQEGEREAAYRDVMNKVAEQTAVLEKKLRDSGYEELPAPEDVDALLYLIGQAEGYLPEHHPTREQFAVQEQAALEVIENIKNSRTYLAAIENAEENARQVRTLIEGKEGMSQMLQGERSMSEEDKELRAQAREAAESEIRKEVAKLTKPIFDTLPRDHPLRRKHREQEQRIEDILWPEKREVRDRETAERKRRESLAQTQRDMPIPEDLDYTKRRPSSGEKDSVDLYEAIGKEAGLEPVGERVRQKPAEAVERSEPESPENKEYRRSMASIKDALASLESGLKEAAERRDLQAIEEVMGQTMNLSYDLQQLRNRKPTDLEDRDGPALEARINDMGTRIEKEARKIREGGDANAAVMLRVPSAPYRMRYTNAGRRGIKATLAAFPDAADQANKALPDVNVQARSMPPVPGDIANKNEEEQLAYLEALLSAFRAEHKRLVDEHNELVKKLTEQVKERKLQALRESLK